MQADHHLLDPLVKEESEQLEKVKGQLPADFSIEVIPKENAVVALFTGAPSIGPMKVYPLAEDYIRENKLKLKGSIVEIYEVFNMKNMQTTYLWPLQD